MTNTTHQMEFCDACGTMLLMGICRRCNPETKKRVAHAPTQIAKKNVADKHPNHTMSDDEYHIWYGTEKDKHGCAVSHFKGMMDNMNIHYHDTDKPGIDFISPNGKECVIHGLGGNADGFVIHDTIDKLKGDIFIYINNMSQRKHIISIMSRETVLLHRRDRGSDPQTMIPLEIMMECVDNYNIMESLND